MLPADQTGHYALLDYVVHDTFKDAITCPAVIPKPVQGAPVRHFLVEPKIAEPSVCGMHLELLEQPVFAEADRQSEIESAVAYTQSQGLRLVIYGGYDAEACADLLKQFQVGVIIGSTYRLPLRRDDPYEHAGCAVADGLPHAEALRASTLSAAEILGVSDRIGSITVGKDATLIIADGDILETETIVTAAYIQGRVVDLGSRHKTLYENREFH